MMINATFQNEFLTFVKDLFPKPANLKKRIESAGFKSVKYINLFDGIVSIHTGYKY